MIFHISVFVVYVLCYRWKDGATYEGTWKDASMHGQGKFTWADGSVYDGNYKTDLFDGRKTTVVFI